METPNKLITDQTIESMHAEADTLAAQRLTALSVLEIGATEALTEARNGNTFDVPQCDYQLARALLEQRGNSKYGWRRTSRGLYTFTLDRWFAFPDPATMIGAVRGPVDASSVPTGIAALKSAVAALGLETAVAYRSAVKAKNADGIKSERKARPATFVYKPLATPAAPIAQDDDSDGEDPLE